MDGAEQSVRSISYQVDYYSSLTDSSALETTSEMNIVDLRRESSWSLSHPSQRILTWGPSYDTSPTSILASLRTELERVHWQMH